MAIPQNQNSIIKARLIRLLNTLCLVVLCLPACLFVSCKNEKSVIDQNAFNGITLTGKLVSVDAPLLTSCTFLEDTLYTNTPLSFSKTIVLLMHLFDSIDNLAINSASKTYLKHVYLADFTASACSELLLGNSFGFSPCQTEVLGWNDMTLEDCYKYANNNNCTIWCGDRATFYKRLADSLLHTTVNIVSVKNTHTYPLVTIDEKNYIIDPYDLFIAIDTITNLVLDYQSIKNKTYKSLFIKDVKPIFENRTKLLSKRLWQNIQQTDTVNYGNVCERINSYVKRNAPNMLKNVPLNNSICFLQQQVSIQPMPTGNYSFAIKSKSRLGSIKYGIPNFYWQYFGTK